MTEPYTAAPGQAAIVSANLSLTAGASYRFGLTPKSHLNVTNFFESSCFVTVLIVRG